jgi:hypothetical protein
MPSRVVREGLLSSESVAQLHDATFRLYVSLILTADDFGLVEIGYGPVRESTALLDWNRERVAAMLAELTDAGLILPYEVERKQYAAIARWRSTVKSRRPKHPVPTFGMGHMLEPYGFKDAATRLATLHLFNHLSSGRVPPEGPQVPPRAYPGTEGVRGKREGVKQAQGIPRGTPENSGGDGNLFGDKPWQCPDGIEPDVWADWLQVRKRKKASTSERAYRDALATVLGMQQTGIDANAVVAKSANSGWTDLYPPERSTKPAHGSPGISSPIFGAFDTTGKV